MRFYVLIEWNGKGSGETVKKSNRKLDMIIFRNFIYTVKQAKKKYYLNYFNSLDVPCSEILTYKAEIDYLTGKDPLSRKVYY